MDLVRHGNLHSLPQEELQRLGEKRVMLGHKDQFPRDRQLLMISEKAAVSISEVTARVLRIEKASCPIRLAVMNLQHLEAVTSLNVTSQALLPICLPESRLHLWTTLAQTL